MEVFLCCSLVLCTAFSVPTNLNCTSLVSKASLRIASGYRNEEAAEVHEVFHLVRYTKASALPWSSCWSLKVPLVSYNWVIIILCRHWLTRTDLFCVIRQLHRVGDCPHNRTTSWKVSPSPYKHPTSIAYCLKIVKSLIRTLKHKCFFFFSSKS